MTGEQIHAIGRRRAWAVWGVAIGVYVLAVFHRSSLGVAGLLLLVGSLATAARRRRRSSDLPR